MRFVFGSDRWQRVPVRSRGSRRRHCVSAGAGERLRRSTSARSHGAGSSSPSTARAQRNGAYMPTTPSGSALYAFTDTRACASSSPSRRALSCAARRSRGDDRTVVADERVLWSGELGTHHRRRRTATRTSRHASSGLKPKRWTPQSPALYRLEVEAQTRTQLERPSRASASAASARRTGRSSSTAARSSSRATRSIRPSATSPTRSRRTRGFVERLRALPEERRRQHHPPHAPLAGLVRRLRRARHDALPGQLRHTEGRQGRRAAPTDPARREPSSGTRTTSSARS